MRKLFILLIICFCLADVRAAYLKDIPMTVTQPDGTELQCFASGDEYFNYLHDKDGYTIIQHPQTGYYVYAAKVDGKLVATNIIAGRQDPASMGLKPYSLISSEEWIARRRAWRDAEKPIEHRDGEPNHGTLNNISIFIRFSDDPELTNSYYDIDNMFNSVSSGAISLRSYFRAASYNAIEIPTTFYPGHNGNTIISYQDTYPRSYFEPYNANTNPNGYQESERAEREFSLLERAVNYINLHYPIPTSLDIDFDNDGLVDNVCFIVKGGVGAWNALLWPHKWSLYDRDVYINGKIVRVFNFQLADGEGYFTASTMCHEMNHSLSAPDLYHYYVGTDLTPVGRWDLMASNTTPPQHCCAYMKMKYGHWVDEIPEITTPGVYTLNPVSSATPTNIAYKIPSPDPEQFYVVEYRDKTSLFDSNLYGSGLLIYRINTNFDGNAYYDPDEGDYDEVYFFRPGGSQYSNGEITEAFFNPNVGRSEFNASTSAYPFLTDGTIDNNLMIYNITAPGNTISFTYGYSTACSAPTNFTATFDGNDVSMSWDAASNAQSYNVYRSGELIGNTSGTTYTDSNVTYGSFTYCVRSVDSNGMISDASEMITVNTMPEGYVFIGDGSIITDDYLPSYSYYNYSLTQQIYTSAEIGDAGNISTIGFYNGGATKTRTYDIYMKHTTKSSFNSNTDWISVTTSDKVFSGSVTMTADSWTMITLDTPFAYNGTSNVVLVVDDNSGSWSNSPHMSCRTFNAPSQAILIYSDNTNYNPNNAGSYTGSVNSIKNQIILNKGNVTQNYTISVSANPTNGGYVSGGGTYSQGAACTLVATANTGYTFVNWTKDGTAVSNNATYSFTVTEDASYVANFTLNTYTVTVEVNPAEGGSVTGEGTYQHGSTATVEVTMNQYYFFDYWTMDGTIVSNDSAYTFVVTGDCKLVAHLHYYDDIEENTASGLDVYPNPMQDKIYLKGIGIQSVKVYNALGQVVISKEFGNAENVELEVGDFVNGVYMVEVRMADGSLDKRTVIKQ